MVVGEAVYTLGFAVIALTGTPPILVVGVVFLTVGFLAGVGALGYTVVKERHDSSASGVATGTVNTVGFTGAAVLPTLMGAILDAYWTGETVGGARIYSQFGYRVAFGLAAFAGFVAFCCAAWLHVREA